MQKGRVPSVQKLNNITEIQDVNFFGDGVLHTVWVLREDVIYERMGAMRVRTGANILSIEVQEPVQKGHSVRIPEAVFRRARIRFGHKRVPL